MTLGGGSFSGGGFCLGDGFCLGGGFCLSVNQLSDLDKS